MGEGRRSCLVEKATTSYWQKSGRPIPCRYMKWMLMMVAVIRSFMHSDWKETRRTVKSRMLKRTWHIVFPWLHPF